MAVTREDNLRTLPLGYRDILLKETPQESAAKKHKELLEAKQIKVFFSKKKDAIVYGKRALPDYATQAKALDMYYKVIGAYDQDKQSEPDHPDLSGYIDALAGVAVKVWGDNDTED